MLLDIKYLGKCCKFFVNKLDIKKISNRIKIEKNKIMNINK